MNFEQIISFINENTKNGIAPSVIDLNPADCASIQASLESGAIGDPPVYAAAPPAQPGRGRNRQGFCMVICGVDICSTATVPAGSPRVVA